MKRACTRWTRALVVAALAWPVSAVHAQETIDSFATIDEDEGLLIGAIDMSLFTLNNPERSFFLKGNVPYNPDESQRLTLETVRGYSGKYFFFVKLEPQKETTSERLYTISVRLPTGRYRNVVSFPVSVRQCGVSEKGDPLCVGGLTDLGSVVVKTSGSGEDDPRSRFEYEFTRVKDPDVKDAFARRFEIEEEPRETTGTVFAVRRR